MEPSGKARVRDGVRAALDGMNGQERLRRAARLPKRLEQLPDMRGRRGALMGYLAFGNELDVSGAFWVAWSYGRAVCVPATDWDAATITPVAYTPGAVIERVRHGVPEPADKVPVPIDRIGVVLVPGVAFTKDGHRLGRGGGFYDRFLETLLALGASRPVFVGVCYEEQVVHSLPTEAHDVPMDTVIAV
ncbi:MAG: 5-formyltetrahydrofolate cyclo-ligase [Phycisphaerales bacterium]